MKQQTAGLIRQGDVLLIPATHPRYRTPTGPLTPVKATGTVFVLAEGEVTGHAHTVPVTTTTLTLDEGGVRYLTVAQLTAVEHQEHAPVALAPTPLPYQVTIQREWSDALEPRKVLD